MSTDVEKAIPKTPEKLVIIGFQSNNLANSYIVQVTNTVRKEAAKFEGIQIISQGQVDSSLRYGKISKNQAINTTGLAKQFGRSLGAQKVITGLVSQIDDLYIISLSLSNTMNEESRSSTKNYRGSFNNFLSNAVKDAVYAVLEN